MKLSNKKVKNIFAIAISIFLIFSSIVGVVIYKNYDGKGKNESDSTSTKIETPEYSLEDSSDDVFANIEGGSVENSEGGLEVQEDISNKPNGEVKTTKKNTTTIKVNKETSSRTYPKGNYKAGLINGSSVSQSEMDQCADVVLAFLDKYVTEDMSEYEKARVALDYLQNTCTYSQDLPNDTSNLYGALVKHKCDCWGYSSAYQYLCVAMDMTCYFVIPKNTGNDMHRFNIVKVDGRHYIVDAQVGIFLVGENDYPFANEDTMKNYPRCPYSYKYLHCSHNWRLSTYEDGYYIYSCPKCDCSKKEKKEHNPNDFLGEKSEYVELMNLINKERKAQGLNQLFYFSEFQTPANNRAMELKEKFSTTRPDGNSSYTIYDKYDTNTEYNVLGETIYSASTPEVVFNQIMNSSSKKRTLMNTSAIGLVVARYENYWTVSVVHFNGETTSLNNEGYTIRVLDNSIIKREGYAFMALRDENDCFVKYQCVKV